MESKVRRHVRSNVVGYVALFVALSGTAMALPGKNTVDSGDIINGQVKSKDIRDGKVTSIDVADDAVASVDVANDSLTGSDVANGSLSGADIADGSIGGADVDENSLGRVPNASLGGYGRSFNGSGAGCDPSTTTFIDCGHLTLNLPQATRVLMVAVTRAFNNSGTGSYGVCRLATSQGVLSNTDVGIHAQDAGALTSISGVVGPGSVDFGLECNQVTGNVAFFEIRISAVALSTL